MLYIIQRVGLLNLFSVFAVTCFSQKATILSGKINGIDSGSIIYLSQTSKNETIDSFTVKNNDFQFELPIEKGDIYFVNFSIKGQIVGQPVYLQKGDDVHINIEKNFKAITYSGSPLANEQNDFIEGLYEIYTQDTLIDRKLQDAKDSVLIQNLNQQKADVNNKRQAYFKTWVQKHLNSAFSVAIIYLFMQKTDIAVLENLYNNLYPQAKENNLVVDQIPFFFAQRKEEEYFKPGEKIKEFVLNNTSGIPQSFYKLKGDNYVLIDIWASWCAPCRKSSPELKKLLDTYNNHNFKIIGISADEDNMLWKEAVIKDGMNWYQLSDLKGTDAGFIKESHIILYPTYIIVSPDGTILSRPGNIVGVKEELSKIFDN